MRLIDLRANHIDPDEYIAYQERFIAHCRKELEAFKDKINYGDYAKKDKFLSRVEQMLNQLERERLQEKIHEINLSAS